MRNLTGLVQKEQAGGRRLVALALGDARQVDTMLLYDKCLR